MKKAMLMCAVLISGSALADNLTASCEKCKTDLTGKFAAQCPDEAAQAKGASCGTKDNLNAMIKLFSSCGKKRVSAPSTDPSTQATTASKTPASTTSTSSSGLKPPTAAEKGGGVPCKALALDGTTVLFEDNDRTLACMSKLKEKVAASKCDGSSKQVEFLYSEQLSTGKWTKGSKLKALCPKK